MGVEKIIICCPKCKQKVRVPTNRGRIGIHCKCGNKFEFGNSLFNARNKDRIKRIYLLLIILGILIGVLYVLDGI